MATVHTQDVGGLKGRIGTPKDAGVFPGGAARCANLSFTVHPHAKHVRGSVTFPMHLWVILLQLVSLGPVDGVGLPGEPHDDGYDGGLEEEHDPVGGGHGGRGQAGQGVGGQQQGGAEQDGPHLHLDHLELVQDGQEGAAVEPLVAVAPDVEAAGRQALRDLADVEDGRHQQPEAVAVEEAGHGGGGGQRGGGGGVGVRRPGEEAVEDGRGRDEEREEKNQRPDDVSMLPPPLPGIAAGQDADDGDDAGARDVEGLEEGAELRDDVGQFKRTRRVACQVRLLAFRLHDPRPRVDVVVVRQRGAHGVGADGAVVHEEADLPHHQRHGVQQVGHAAGHQQAPHPDAVVPQRVEERGVGARRALPPEHLRQVVGEDEDGQEVGPEVAGLVGGPEGGQQAVPQAVVGEAVAGQDEVLDDPRRDVRVPQQRQRLVQQHGGRFGFSLRTPLGVLLSGHNDPTRPAVDGPGDLRV